MDCYSCSKLDFLFPFLRKYSSQKSLAPANTSWLETTRFAKSALRTERSSACTARRKSTMNT